MREAQQQNKLALDKHAIIAFALSGAIAGIDKKADIFGVIFLGIATALGGGILRDVLTSVIPSVLRKRVYAVASLAGALVYYTMLQSDVHNALSTVLAMLLIFVIRLFATKFRWNLPRA